jgi:NAD(P)-dependent dehydrogenase (short-subunit alcohol dehydrogenase family)
MTEKTDSLAGLCRLFSLEGKVALVTGATMGLGLHFARVLHQAGAKVAFAGRSIGRIAADVETLGDRAMAVALDVADGTSIAPAFDAIEARFGACDLLVNNAGIAITKPLLDYTEADWDSVIDVNLKGAFLVAKEAARRMIAAKQPGTIINVASIIGLRTAAGVISYAASKAGLINVTRQLALELARHGIRVNALTPGYVLTDLNRDYFAGEHGQAMIKRVPLRRLGTPEGLTGPLLLLASEAGAHMNGAVLVVDDGHSINSL